MKVNNYQNSKYNVNVSTSVFGFSVWLHFSLPNMSLGHITFPQKFFAKNFLITWPLQLLEGFHLGIFALKILLGFDFLKYFLRISSKSSVAKRRPGKMWPAAECDLVTEDAEEVELLNAFFTSVFTASAAHQESQ